MSRFFEKIKSIVEMKREEFNLFLQQYKNINIGEIKISQIINGMRGLMVLFTDLSSVDPEKGIIWRGYTVDEVLQKLPKPSLSKMPYVEAQFYLLITGDIPSETEVREIIDIFNEKRKLPDYVYTILKTMPKETDPNIMLSVAINSMQHESIFTKAYQKGKVTKYNAWEYMLEDVLNLLPKISIISAFIYRLKYKNNMFIKEDDSLDLGGNFAYMMGINRPYDEFLRLYMILLSDHENGNVSAHTTHLVASALADAYCSISAGINGLSGPLHGGAIKESFNWFMNLYQQKKNQLTKEILEQICVDMLNKGLVIPGYGHAVLRNKDPRFLAQMKFGEEYLKDDELFQIACFAFDTIPYILKKHTKINNPWPNVDNISGIIHSHYGMDKDFFTVLFSNSIAIGSLANIFWDRALNLPIERPKSVTISQLLELVKTHI
ncbi:citrate (Si)-synthase [Desulfurella sp.]|uniref:citrate (Si)-synthase n=1 Tax=Desulfurella sp. TaxID=1962857 RepID=UPI003D0D4FF7